jgi:hypothetical protein
MQGPSLNTLQNDGVHGWPSRTLQGACENGVASIWRRDWASAALTPANKAIRQTVKRRNMRRSLGWWSSQIDAGMDRYQGARRSLPRVHGEQFRNQGLPARLVEHPTA